MEKPFVKSVSFCEFVNSESILLTMSAFCENSLPAKIVSISIKTIRASVKITRVYMKGVSISVKPESVSMLTVRIRVVVNDFVIIVIISEKFLE